MIPFDKRKPLDPSGIRIGTAALTTRGMKTDEMKQVGNWILQVLKDVKNLSLRESIREEIREFCQNYPVPGIRVKNLFSNCLPKYSIRSFCWEDGSGQIVVCDDEF